MPAKLKFSRAGTPQEYLQLNGRKTTRREGELVRKDHLKKREEKPLEMVLYIRGGKNREGGILCWRGT